MAVTVTHPFVSAIADGADATVVRPSNWNATHSLSGTVDVANGGTNISSYAIGDILYASTTGILSKLADVATGNALISGGVGVAPSYGKIALTTHISGTLPVANGGTGLTTGTSGGVLAFTAAGTIASSAALTQYGVVYGGGAGVVPSATANGTTGQVLTATTSGAPSWANPATSGTVTSVSWTGGIVSVATATTTPALTIAGTSGGIPYFSSGTTWATSAALAASALVIGGGAGVAPSTTTTATGALTFLGTPSSANLAALLTDETGTGASVFGTAPTLSNPTITAYLETAPAIANSSTAVTLALASGTVLSYTLTGNCTFTMPTATSGTSFIVRLIQDATGSRTATFTGVKWPGGTVPTITTTASTGVDIISFVCIASVWYGNAAQAFA